MSRPWVGDSPLGIAASGAIVAVRVPVHLAALGDMAAVDAGRQALALGIRDAFIVAGLVCCLGIVTSLVRGGRSDPVEGA